MSQNKICALSQVNRIFAQKKYRSFNIKTMLKLLSYLPIYLYFKIKLMCFTVEIPGAECEISKLCENGYEKLSLNRVFWGRLSKN